MNEKLEQMDPFLMQLVLSLQAGAMQQMGKVVSPVSGKIERDLVMARNTIDILAMIDNKTKGNLTEEETKLVGHILYELRLNYVDESQKDSAKPAEDSSEDTKEANASENSAESSEEKK